MVHTNLLHIQIIIATTKLSLLDYVRRTPIVLLPTVVTYCGKQLHCTVLLLTQSTRSLRYCINRMYIIDVNHSEISHTVGQTSLLSTAKATCVQVAVGRKEGSRGIHHT